ncbi:MAG: hypothetical protein L0Y32_03215 [Nevskiales bacterium]|nr:hypothetical protein [Nevskiales bacterium]
MQCGAAVAVMAVNGDRERGGRAGSCTFAVPEGQYVFTVTIAVGAEAAPPFDQPRAGDGVVQSGAEHPMVFWARAGHTYRIDAVNDGFKYLPWQIIVTDVAAPNGQFVVKKRAKG